MNCIVSVPNKTKQDIFFQLINLEVPPTLDEVRLGQTRIEEKKATHAKRLARRRRAYRKKHGTDPSSDADLSLDKTNTDDEEDDEDEPDPDPNLDLEAVDSAGRQTNAIIVSDHEQQVVVDLSRPREEIMQQLFGSDIGTSSSSSNNDNVVQIEVPLQQGQVPADFQVLAEGSAQVSLCNVNESIVYLHKFFVAEHYTRRSSYHVVSLGSFSISCHCRPG